MINLIFRLFRYWCRASLGRSGYGSPLWCYVFGYSYHGRM